MTASVSTRVVLAVAEKKGADPTELPPLHRAIDPDALDALFDPGSNGDGRGQSCDLRFPYAGHSIRVQDGIVTVEEIYRGQGGQPAGSDVSH